MAADEAIILLDNFLDSAYMGNLPTARIIHGKGTGVLRAAVHDELRRCKYVKSFRLGVYGEGESGVTIWSSSKMLRAGELMLDFF